jgi:hypothetical protein
MAYYVSAATFRASQPHGCLTPPRYTRVRNTAATQRFLCLDKAYKDAHDIAMRCFSLTCRTYLSQIDKLEP